MKWFRRKDQPEAVDDQRLSRNPFEIDIPSDDPLRQMLANSEGPLAVDEIELSSPALDRMRREGVELLVPMVSGGELIAVLQLGARLSDQLYTEDDKRLLSGLAAQAAPALRVAQLLHEREEEARALERVEAELRVAQLIQHNFLPTELPAPPGWTVDAYYQPAREVGGDFYDFVELDGGLLGIVVGDVTDKGVPAALVMASTRSVLKAAAESLKHPALVLERVNDQLHGDIPERMFVTCLFGVLDPASGSFIFANAGHNLPVHIGPDRVDEPRATGMPLGMMPGSTYEEVEVELSDGDTLFLYSDALPEAHDPEGQMYGFEAVRRAVATAELDSLISDVLAAVTSFTGAHWEQEDDITIVTISKAALSKEPYELTLASVPGNERRAVEWLEKRIGGVLSPERLDRAKTAVTEAVMNAMEHGNRFDPDLPVVVTLADRPDRIVVKVADRAHGNFEVPAKPDLDAKLRGEQSTRGWGMFLIENLVDGVSRRDTPSGRELELEIHKEERSG